MSSPDDSKPVAATPEEWGRRLWQRAARVLVASAIKRMEEPGAADEEVDGDDESGSWDEPAAEWMNAKKAAVRKVMACMINDVASLPPIGARVERITLQAGAGHVYFEDGSFVAFSIEDMMPKQSPSPCSHTAAAGALDMVAAVRGHEMLGALDVNRRGAQDVRFWGVKVGAPFELYRLHEVPMRDAVPLNDFGSRTTRLRDGKQAWALARRYAESQPFKRVR